MAKRYKKEDRAKRLVVITTSVILLTLGIVGGFSKYKSIQANAETKRVEDEKVAAEKEAARLEEERIKAEEAERNREKIGVGPNGEAFKYDAKIVWDKINKRDFTNNGEKTVFLTFDDGPSTTVTPKVLDVLKKNDVKATFFVMGKNLEDEKSQEILKRIYDEGHAIANHSYNHNYKTLYPNRTLNLANFMADVDKTNEKISEVLGTKFKSNVVRCPGGYMSWKGMDALKAEFEKRGMSSIDWNALNGDAQGKKGKTPAELLQEAKNTIGDKEMAVVLMHDTYGKENTAEMLDGLIKYLKEEGYTFKTLV